MSDIIDHRIKNRPVGMKFAPFDTITGINDNQFPFLKEYTKGKVSYTFSSDPSDGKITLATITHGLNYCPAGYVIIKGTSTEYPSNDTVEARHYLPQRLFDICGTPNPYDGYIYQWIKYYFTATQLILYFEQKTYGTIGSPHLNRIYNNGDTVELEYYIFADPGM